MNFSHKIKFFLYYYCVYYQKNVFSGGNNNVLKSRFNAITDFQSSRNRGRPQKASARIMEKRGKNEEYVKNIRADIKEEALLARRNKGNEPSLNLFGGETVFGTMPTETVKYKPLTIHELKEEEEKYKKSQLVEGSEKKLFHDLQQNIKNYTNTLRKIENDKEVAKEKKIVDMNKPIHEQVTPKEMKIINEKVIGNIFDKPKKLKKLISWKNRNKKEEEELPEEIPGSEENMAFFEDMLKDYPETFETNVFINNLRQEPDKLPVFNDDNSVAFDDDNSIITDDIEKFIKDNPRAPTTNEISL